ncbi:ArpU family phage packaging/lysis transcriptional regulator [Bacillus licheniformis]|uniref:ArpU family phage packaging/lysis transcriptional regulator n=1 Tax=Bacillus TaxID=1386 RepID=UPI000471C511|nr:MULTISPECIES: ArpU family phage packaging/lysis transcriptional regulator [Bacillus]MCA1184590.1 DUF1492 domain-containing protein [Bacillus licheniformis]MCQ5304580.1 DUF1492 domain-containing protein [Bacillus licheniformis]MDM5287372.1 ArpU family phage packaging/lysis transcriptional regulator [Bacillus licheniformis]MDN5390091.1 ArpU family phage packaging/lysis transcriptional regulator [Bacillus sp. LB7]MEC0776916.1 ArpU family phage packaging/lysis transcriptional regulator [Bacillu
MFTATDPQLIDERRTITNVIAKLKLYEVARLRLENDDLPSTTSSYQLIPVCNNQFNSSVENYVQEREEMIEFANKVAKAINRLERDLRLIIIEKYIMKKPNHQIADRLCISHRTLYRKNNKALVQLGIALDLVCWKN